MLTANLKSSGDIEDMLKTVAFIKGHKWTSMMIKRVYFGTLCFRLESPQFRPHFES